MIISMLKDVGLTAMPLKGDVSPQEEQGDVQSVLF